MQDYYRIADGHLQRLMRDYSSGRRVTPSDNPPETAWLHCCEADQCGAYTDDRKEISAKLYDRAGDPISLDEIERLAS